MTPTTPPPDRPPLWSLMRDAETKVFTLHPKPLSHECDAAAKAAEIRALADAVVPEEPPIERTRYTIGRWTRRDERQTLRALLLAEAEWAEQVES